VRWGYVVDFLDFYVGQWHWPAFNVADMGISGGVVIIIVLSLLKKDYGLFSEPNKSE
jgi:signal peptidase II